MNRQEFMASFQNASHALKDRQRREKMARRIAPNWGAGLENDMTPVNAHMLPDVPGGVVELHPELYELLDTINRRTVESGQEIPFLLYGRVNGQNVCFESIDAKLDNLSGAEASFDQDLVSRLSEFIRTSPHDGTQIVAHGHTHPRTGAFYHNFSVGDLDTYKDFKEKNSVFNTGKMECCAVLLVDGQYNFLFYDKDANDYFRFRDVFTRDANGRRIKLPSYGGPACIGMTRGRGHE